jgi:hypothetical protein
VPEILDALEPVRREHLRLSRSIDREPGAVLDDARALEELDELEEATQRYGWCLGLIACTLGTSVLLTRREADGLRILVELVGRHLARQRVRIEPEARELPRLEAAVGEGWEVAAVCAALFLHSGRRLAPGDALAWKLRRSTRSWCLEVQPAPARNGEAELRRAIEALELDGLRWQPEDAGTVLELPAGWLSEA